VATHSAPPLVPVAASGPVGPGSAVFAAAEVAVIVRRRQARGESCGRSRGREDTEYPLGSKPADRKGKVLFITPTATTARAGRRTTSSPNTLRRSSRPPEPSVPAFARVVSREELAENDDNLNIRRYVDTTPEPEPQDVRAHLHGGILECSRFN
jgi:type I restriction-modification system DNA methylase subunit